MPDKSPEPSAPSSSLKYEIVPIQIEHAESLALAHAICFPGYFLTSLGPAYVALFYHALATSKIGVAVVAVGETGKILCFAAGATTSDDFRRYFYRHFFLNSAWTLLKGFICDRDVRRYVLTQGYRVTDALKLLVKNRPKNDNPKVTEVLDKKLLENTRAFSLMSMGTLPECRGSHLASEIITAFEALVQERGGTAVKTSTGKDNQRAIGFYIKNGYQIYRDTRPGDVDLIKKLIP